MKSLRSECPIKVGQFEDLSLQELLDKYARLRIEVHGSTHSKYATKKRQQKYLVLQALSQKLQKLPKSEAGRIRS